MPRKSLSKKTRFEVFQRDDFACQYCGRRAPDVVLHVDHILAVANGGTNDKTNLITACVDCNLGKRTLVLSGRRFNVLGVCETCWRARIIHGDRRDLGVCAECLTFRRRPWLSAYLAWSKRQAA